MAGKGKQRRRAAAQAQKRRQMSAPPKDGTSKYARKKTRHARGNFSRTSPFMSVTVAVAEEMPNS